MPNVPRRINGKPNPEYDRQYQQERYKEIHEYLGGRCVKCGTTSNLELDHVFPESKSFSIGTRVMYSWESIVDEIDKCQLLCSDCHKEKHAPPHGTRSRYCSKKYKCRCNLCSEANKKYLREYGQKNRY